MAFIACGRNITMLSAMARLLAHTGRLFKYVLISDTEADTAILISQSNNGQCADAYIRFSPALAAKLRDIKSCMAALRQKGKAEFMGGIKGNVEIDHNLVMMKSSRIEGRFMHERDTVAHCIKMIENGNLELGEMVGTKTFGRVGLVDIESLLEMAATEAGSGKQVLFSLDSWVLILACNVDRS